MLAQVHLGDLAVDVIRKDIKNVHLSVYPPAGRVRISAPKHMSLDTIRVFAISKLDWIRQQQTKLREQEREAPRGYVERESYYLWGKRYLLTVTESDQPPAIELKHSRRRPRAGPPAGTHPQRPLRRANGPLPAPQHHRQVLNRLPVRQETWNEPRAAVQRRGDQSRPGGDGS